MKKYINFKAITLLALFLVITLSCDNAQQDVEPIVSTADYPLATFVVSDPVVSEKGGAMVTVDITFDKPIDRSVTFSGTQIGGDATEGVDYEIHGAIVPAFSTSAQLVIEIFEDVEPEAVETIDIQIDRPSLANAYLINPKSDLPLINITIDNYVSETLDISFDWYKEFQFGEDVSDTCTNVDFDVFIFDGASFDINDPMASMIGDFQAATGDCPETFSISPNEYEDGEYVFMAYPYFNGFAGYGTDEFIPITSEYLQAGVFKQTEVQDDAHSLHSDSVGANEAWPPFNEELYYVARVTVADGTFTVSGEAPAGKANIVKKSTNASFNFSYDKPVRSNKLLK